MDELGEWACSSNEAIRLSLQRQGTPVSQGSFFNPTFTYPIFGEEEVIFGYKGLKIKLAFLQDTLDATAFITWKAKYPAVGETKADDVEAKLKPFLQCQDIVAGPDLDVSQAIPTKTESSSFTPPGNLLQTYNVRGRKFGVWSASLADPATKTLLRNLQIFVLFFIEGGTCIELDDPLWTIERWRVFFIYETTEESSYSFVGYSTAYRLSYFDPTSTPPSPASLLENWPNENNLAASSSLRSRIRISQFLILPPWHRQGHGTQLYNTMMAAFLHDATISEVTVEDPNESFDDLRDICDFTALQQRPAFAALRINDAVSLAPQRAQPVPTAALLDTAALAAVRSAAKIADRQFSRLLEMHLLARIPARHRSTARIARRDRASDAHDRAYYFWRLLVKQRLYKHNIDVLAQIEAAERVEKLEDTVTGVEEDYVRVLAKIEGRGAAAAAGAELSEPSEPAVTNGLLKRGAKRKVVEDDDDEDEDSDGDGAPAETESSKRARVDDQ